MCYYLFALLAVCFFYNIAAENSLTCPSIYSVHHSINIWPNGEWLPLNRDNEELASETDINEFIVGAKKFDRAEWSGDYLEMAHCFYVGNDKIVLAKNMLKPKLIGSFWRSVSKKLLRCTMPSEEPCLYGGVG